MDITNVNLDQLGTLAGLSAVTLLVVGALKGVTGLTGRWTHLAALLVALGLAVAFNAEASTLHTPMQWVRVLVYALVAASAAIGAHQSTVGVKK